jgi:hypothetical protein
MIDTSPVFEEEMEVDNIDDENDHDSSLELMVAREATLRPIRTLYPFSTLQKLVAAQEAYFSVSEDLLTCELPVSIEELHIMDATCAVHWYFDQLAEWREPSMDFP